jgi:p-aminobenzoyl-glutamate transporter AbgT
MIRMLFAAAVALFVLSLPVHATGLGAAMRRWAGVCFVAALLPSLIVGLFFPGVHASFTEHPIGTVFALLLAVGVAYFAYAIRKWLHDDPAKKQLRLPEKTPIERSRRQQDLFAFLADNQPPQGPQP